MTPTGFRLGEFVVEPATDRLVHVDTGARIDLEPKTMDVLVALAERTDEVVSSATLIECVWHGRPMGDNPVYKAVAKLRRALHDEATAPRYIETIPRKGYRLLVAPVAVPLQNAPLPVGRARLDPPPLLSAGPESLGPSAPLQLEEPADTPARPPRFRHWRAALTVAVLIATASVAWLHRSAAEPETVAKPSRPAEHVSAAPTHLPTRPVAQVSPSRPTAAASHA
jgi:DNA-binding winged helix-turn-helix (wHTH) protein